MGALNDLKVHTERLPLFVSPLTQLPLCAQDCPQRVDQRTALVTALHKAYALSLSSRSSLPSSLT